jgi:hypothetical protein
VRIAEPGAWLARSDDEGLAVVNSRRSDAASGVTGRRDVRRDSPDTA